MRKRQSHRTRQKWWLRFGAALLLTLFCVKVYAQEAPPKPISVYANPAEGLFFGALFQGTTGGTLTLYPNGTRVTTGDILEANLGIPFSAAVFEIEANPGTLVSIMNGPDVVLTGSNGGSITLHIGTSDLGSSFVTTAIAPVRTEVRIGGTLTIGNAATNPSGSYSGTFYITFIQE